MTATTDEDAGMSAPDSGPRVVCAYCGRSVWAWQSHDCIAAPHKIAYDSLGALVDALDTGHVRWNDLALSLRIRLLQHTAAAAPDTTEDT
jgi:hypothetical protein